MASFGGFAAFYAADTPRPPDQDHHRDRVSLAVVVPLGSLAALQEWTAVAFGGCVASFTFLAVNALP